jgi:Zn-dependent protease
MRIPGSWTIARPFGVPLRIHWSVPVCALLAGGIRVAPGAWLAYLLLVLIHEAGHALVVRRAGGRPTALEVLGFGGLCWWEGSVSPVGRACIAWGGVWAQMVVLALTLAGTAVFGKPGNDHGFVAQMIDVAITGNLWLIGVNLLPIPPLDGAEAWRLFPLLARRRAARRALLAPPSARVAPLGRLQIPVPRLSRREIERPTPASSIPDFDEHSFTPEALAVIERARTIAREAAQGPRPAGDMEGQGDRKSGGA